MNSVATARRVTSRDRASRTVGLLLAAPDCIRVTGDVDLAVAVTEHVAARGSRARHDCAVANLDGARRGSGARDQAVRPAREVARGVAIARELDAVAVDRARRAAGARARGVA